MFCTSPFGQNYELNITLRNCTKAKSVNHHSIENVHKTVLHPSEILILIKKCKSPFGTEKTDDIAKNGPDTYIIPSPLLTNLERL